MKISTSITGVPEIEGVVRRGLASYRASLRPTMREATKLVLHKSQSLLAAGPSGGGRRLKVPGEYKRTKATTHVVFKRRGARARTLERSKVSAEQRLQSIVRGGTAKKELVGIVRVRPPFFYLRFHEVGYRLRRGRMVREMPATPFLAPALAATKERVVALLGSAFDAFFRGERA